MARPLGCLILVAVLCPHWGFSRIIFQLLPRDTIVDFEAGILFPFEAEDWVDGSIWKPFSYKNLEKELNATAPRPPEGGGLMLARLDIKGTSAGSFMTLPMTKNVTEITMLFDYFLKSSLGNAAGIRIEYQVGNSGYKVLDTFFPPTPNDTTFHAASAKISLENAGSITVRIYGNGNGGPVPDIVAIDNFRIKLKL